jgi:uncharacterized membrane protein YtjA (UPF0391 family)
MFNYAGVFLIITLLAGAIGAAATDGTAAMIASVLFLAFLGLFITSLFYCAKTGSKPVRRPSPTLPSLFP